jgi:hypothetical protein
MKKTALNKLIGIMIIILLIGTSYTVVIASERMQNSLDEEPPIISNIIINPEIQTANGYVNISCNITDNVAVAQVNANITYPDTSMHNETMVYNNESDLAYFNTTYTMVGEYSLYIWAMDNSSNTAQSDPFGFTIEEAQNHPPYIPSNPYPSDGATGIPIDAILTWEGGDPDGDTVLYDVLFGVNASPPTVSPNQLNTTYDPGLLEYDTIYYWQILAKDGNGGSAFNNTWSFTTAEATGNITLEITYPTEPGIYRNGNKLSPGLLNRYIFYGPIEVHVDASSPVGISDVTFQLGNRAPVQDDSSPYIFTWDGLMSGRYTIEITATDENQESLTTQITVLKWRIHPALIALGGLAALKGIANIAQGKPAFGWTIIRGTALNIKEQGNDLVFRAFRLHYTEITGSSFSSGVLRLKKVKISDVGVNRMITLGPFGSFNYIFAICKGGMREG